MKVPFLDVGVTYRELEKEINQCVKDVLESGWYIHGEQLKLFEQEFARFCEVKH